MINRYMVPGYAQLPQDFRKGGELRRRSFIEKCVCLSPKGESAFFMKKQDSKSIFEIPTNNVALILGDP